jgi:gliding motility-associated-like protein
LRHNGHGHYGFFLYLQDMAKGFCKIVAPLTIELRALLPVIIHVLFSCLLALQAQAQPTDLRFMNWHFGRYATLHFGASPPYATNSSPIWQDEGCATISTRNGQLLFFTEGVKVWDRGYNQMPNGFGLLGDQSSSMSGIIAPYIGNSNKYYIFTADHHHNNGSMYGLNYSIVDMGLNNGAGDIIQNKKNIQLTDSTSEAILAIRGQHASEYWIVVQKRATDTIHAYKVDCNGVNDTPVVSAVGSPAASTGYMAVNHAQNKIAMVVQSNPPAFTPTYIQVCDFDQSTGAVSNPVTISNVYYKHYGLYFSPNDSFLYFTAYGSPNPHIFGRYEVYAPNPPASEHIIHSTTSSTSMGALTKGIDGQLYVRLGTHKLGTVKFPDEAVNYHFDSTYIILPYHYPYIQFSIGLPIYFDVWPEPLTVPDTLLCLGTGGHIGNDSLAGWTYAWSPGATLSDSTVASPLASPTVPTTYTVVATNGSCSDTATVFVDIHADTAYITSSTGSLVRCAWVNQLLTAHGGRVLHWYHNGDSVYMGHRQTILATDTGLYQAVVLRCGGTIDTVDATLYFQTPPVVQGPADSVWICPGDSVTLTVAGSGLGAVRWLNGLGTQVGGAVDSLRVGLSGPYTVQLRDSCGYHDTVQFHVFYHPLPQIMFDRPDPAYVCYYDTVPLSVLGDSVTAWHIDGAPALPPYGNTIAISATGRYRATAQNMFGCTDTASVLLHRVPPLSGLIATTGGPVCAGDTLRLAATPAQGTYQWAPAGLFDCDTCKVAFARPLMDTTAYLAYTDLHGCLHHDSAHLAVEHPPTLTAGPDTTVCPGRPVRLRATVSPMLQVPTYLWSPAGPLPANGPQPMVVAQATTTYTVTVRHGLCTLRDSVTVTVLASALSATASPPAVCAGGATVLSATSPDSLVDYQWAPPAGLVDPYAPMTTAYIHAPAIYTVTATDPRTGCTYSATVYTDTLAPPAVAVDGPTVMCPGAQVALRATGGASYAWAPHPSLSCTACPQPMAAPTATTTYTVTATGTNGCTATATHTVDVVQQLSLDVPGDTALCAGGSVALYALGADTLRWSPAATLSCTDCPAPLATPHTTTTYMVAASAPGGCADTAYITVSVWPPPPTLPAGPPTPLCPGDTVHLPGPPGMASYAWAPAMHLDDSTAQRPAATPLSSTWFTLALADSNGCTSTDSLWVAVLPVSGTLPGDRAACAGDTVRLEAAGFVAYTWAAPPGAPLPCTACPAIDVAPQATTVYSLTATDTAGCTVEATATATVWPLPAVALAGPGALCAGDTVLLTASGGGSGTYGWAPIQGLVPDGPGRMRAAPAYSTTYTAGYRDANGCLGTDTHRLDVLPRPHVTASGDTTLCPGQGAPLHAHGATAYAWQPQAWVDSPAAAAPIATPLATATFTVTGTGANGCTNSATVTVALRQPPLLALTPDTSLCRGDTIVLQALAQGSAVLWAPATGLACPTCPTTQAAPAATTSYVATATDSFGCAATAAVQVAVGGPTGGITGPAQACPGDTALLQATGNATAWLWMPGGQSTPAITVTAATTADTYTLVLTDSSGCTATATHVVAPFDTAGPHIIGPAEICEGDTAFWTAAPLAHAAWAPGNLQGAGVQLSPMATTTYTLTATDSNGCRYLRTRVLTVHPRPPVDAGPDLSTRPNVAVQLQGSGAHAYLWTPGTLLDDPAGPGPRFLPPLPGTYVFTLTGTSVDGCTADDSMAVDVADEPKPLLPNAFSPNGDGHNDLFEPWLPQGFVVLELAVFDRWGGAVYRGTGPWNGTQNGRHVPIGTYVAILHYIGPDGQAGHLAGNVTVLR